MVSCILLSAGKSERFGSAKALATIDSTPVINHQLQTLLDAQVPEIIIVLGAWVDEIKPYLLNHKDIKIVYNKDYNFGQTSSFKVGLNQADPSAIGHMLLPVDCPFIKQETIEGLINEYLKYKPLGLIPTYEGRKGHPPIFSAELAQEIKVLDNNKGINSVIHEHSSEIMLHTSSDPGVIQSFNTKEEFEKLLIDYGSR